MCLLLGLGKLSASWKSETGPSSELRFLEQASSLEVNVGRLPMGNTWCTRPLD